MLVDQPASVQEFAQALGWKDKVEMVAELDLFEDQSWLQNDESVSEPTPTELPDGLRDAIDLYGSRFSDLQDPAWQQYLATFNWRTGQPSEAERWLDLYRDLARAGVVPGEN
ncbi:hypothetical protein ACFP81_10485 [Deinococcus lacus]|uniref:Uncharacterized protein n=1 Tax=Deinococcus lacus TaxID=392561 RepID=A0ABW1YFP0_9DEIO